MKKTMITICTLFCFAALLFIPQKSNAQDRIEVNVGGAKYALVNFGGKDVAQLYSHDNDLIKDTLIIPKFIDHNGKKYEVSISETPIFRGAEMKVLIIEADGVLHKWFCRKCPYLTNVIIKGQIDAIEEEAFWNCFNLKMIKFNNGLAFIGARAFEYCYALEEVTLPESVYHLGGYAFKDCESLKKVTIKNKKLASQSLGMFFKGTPYFESLGSQTANSNGKRKPNQAVTNNPRFKVNKKSGTIVY